MNKLYIFSIVFLLYANVLSAQMYPDRHNTNSFDSWISCTSSTSPNVARGDVHWIMYDLGHEYALNELQIWNANMPDSTDMGLQNIIIDYSTDGLLWSELGSYTLNQSTSSSSYEGEMVADFNNATAKYVLINAESNFGGNCYSFSELKINVGQASVPVQLLSFNVSCTENNLVKLDWTTASEINNDHFEIERSTNGTNWSNIGNIDATPIVQHENHYQFIDELYKGELSYYRLRQVDRDGGEDNSPTRSIKCGISENDFELYPNPAQDFVELNFKDIEIKEVRLFDLQGKRISINSSLETNKIRIDLKEIPTGTYLLKIESDQKTIAKEFIKIE